MAFKNNVTRFLDSKKFDYQLHQYEYSDQVHSAVDVANAIGLPVDQVFKTLVVMADTPQAKPMAVILPGPSKLDMRAFAKAVGHKKVKMAGHDQAESLTGMQTGGISPLGLVNSNFAIFLDESASRLDTIAVSAGERGAQIEIDVSTLIHLTNAQIVSDIST